MFAFVFSRKCLIAENGQKGKDELFENEKFSKNFLFFIISTLVPPPPPPPPPKIRIMRVGGRVGGRHEDIGPVFGG